MSVRKRLSYEEFVQAVENKNIIFQTTNRQGFIDYPISPLRNGLMRILAILMFIPIGFIPVICYFTHTWLLLLGFISAYLGLVIAGINNKTSNPLRSFRSLILSSGFLLIVLVFYLGFFHTVTFLIFCYLYEFIIVALNDLVRTYYIKDCLLKSPSDYNTAVENELIITYLKQ